MKFSIFIGLTAIVASVCALSPNASPVSQIRVGFNGPTGMTVSWNSHKKVPVPTVWYSEDINVMCGSVATSGPSTIYDSAVTWDNHVYIDGLKPFTKYYYKVSGQDLSEADQENSYFMTARAAGDTTPFAIAAFADLGTETGTSGDVPATFQSLQNLNETFEFLWHSGDFGYADDWPLEILTGTYSLLRILNAYSDIMANFYNMMEPLSKSMAYMVGPGNHEAQCDEVTVLTCPPGQRNFTAYRNHFSMPTVQQVDGSYQNMWYSWDYGMVHFIQIDTETDFPDNPEEPVFFGLFRLNGGPFGAPNQQVEWLEADLKAVDRTKTPWVVVSGHRPWFGSGGHGSGCAQAFDGLMNKYGVDLVWAGHVHYYERDSPLINGAEDPAGLDNPTGPLYIISGHGGNYEGHSDTTSDPGYQQIIDNTNYGWSRFTFQNATSLLVEYIGSANDEVLDSAILTKCHGLC